MILAQFTPAVSVTQPNNLFGPPITGSYMKVFANRYTLGSNSARFVVQYGNATFDASGFVTGFKTIASTQVTLDGSAIQNWGTDDSTLFAAIATQIGTISITGVVSGSDNRMHF